eukprot:318350-Chlamydomonas_euryale.AAC.2
MHTRRRACTPAGARVHPPARAAWCVENLQWGAVMRRRSGAAVWRPHLQRPRRHHQLIVQLLPCVPLHVELRVELLHLLRPLGSLLDGRDHVRQVSNSAKRLRPWGRVDEWDGWI